MARDSYRPRLLSYGTPAYCSAGKWIVTYDGDEKASVHYVVSVDRAWIEETGHHAARLGDGSRRKFSPETYVDSSNGRNPCLLYVLGEPHPWYFDSGHESVQVLALDTRSGD